ncbi:hypothetical protein HK096_008895, partial [Nowakowskiella sp. JEL0078]
MSLKQNTSKQIIRDDEPTHLSASFDSLLAKISADSFDPSVFTLSPSSENATSPNSLFTPPLSTKSFDSPNFSTSDIVDSTHLSSLSSRTFTDNYPESEASSNIYSQNVTPESPVNLSIGQQEISLVRQKSQLTPSSPAKKRLQIPIRSNSTSKIQNKKKISQQTSKIRLVPPNPKKLGVNLDDENGGIVAIGSDLTNVTVPGGKVHIAYAMERYEGGGVMITDALISVNKDVPIPVFVKGGYKASATLLENDDNRPVLQIDLRKCRLGTSRSLSPSSISQPSKRVCIVTPKNENGEIVLYAPT